MADKLTEGTILAVGFEYTNTEGKKKTVYLKIPNPNSNLMTEAWIKEQTKQLISGEEPIFKTEDLQSFDSATAIFTAYTENTRSTKFDIGIEN